MIKPKWQKDQPNALLHEYDPYVFGQTHSKVYMIRKDTPKYKVEACVSAVGYIRQVKDLTKGYPKNTFHWVRPNEADYNITIPGEKQIESCNDEYELFTLVMMVNNVSFQVKEKTRLNGYQLM